MKLIPSSRWIQNVTQRLPRWGLLLGLFLAICGAKFWLIGRFGNSTPNGDEWAGFSRVIDAYLNGTLGLMQFLRPHNEHRIAFSRALLLGSYLLNKRWDPFLLMVVQAPIHALAIVIFVALAGRFMSGAPLFGLALFTAVLSMLPLGWQNTLWAFQSCFYFMMLFGIVTIWLCWRYEPLTPLWWLGAAFGLASLFTVAGGVFCVIAIAGFLSMRLALERGEKWRRDLAGAGVLWAIAIFGFVITPKQEPHAHLIATSIGAFTWALSGILFWPALSRWECLIVQGPLLALIALCLVRRLPSKDGRWFLIVCAGAYWIQAAATAYKRCGDWDARRYYDSWGMLSIILCACLCVLADHLPPAKRSWLYPIAGVWLLACIHGLVYRMAYITPQQIVQEWAARMEMENNVRQYLATGDAKWLEGLIPFPTPDFLRHELDELKPRGVLPRNLIADSPPLTPVKRKGDEGPFLSTGVPQGVPALGRPLLGSYTPGEKSRSGVVLEFAVPPGTREVALQVAGYPNARGNVLRVEEPHRAHDDIAMVDPAENWDTIFIQLHPKTSSFKIIATDESRHSWLAFSMPVIVNDRWPGRWAKIVANNSTLVFDIGMALLLACGLAVAKEELPAPNGP